MDSKPKVMKFFFPLLLIFFSSSAYAIDFRGRLYSRAKEKGEAQQSILIFETKQFLQTDANGYFEAKVPKAGEYTFRVIRTSGTQEFKKNISSDGELVTIYTDKVEVPKGGIVVSGEKEKTILSRYKVRQDEIKRMPGTLGEALRGLETLPGVVAPPFGGGEIVIRGADPNQNLYLVDDLPILYPFHLLGLNSVVHNDLIKSIDLYTGAFPSRFFNAIGGVIEIETVDSVKKTGGMASVSLFSTNAIYQTPTAGGKGYIIVAGRVSYLENTLGLTGFVPEGIRLPQYHDSQVKVVHNFNDRHQISFTSLTAQDGFAARLEPRPVNDPTQEPPPFIAGARIALGRGFATQGLRYTWTPGNKFNNRITLIHFDPFNKVNGQLGSLNANTIQRFGYVGLRQDASWEALDWLKIDFGSEYRLLDFDISGTSVRLRNPSNRAPNPYDTLNPAFESIPVSDKPRSLYTYGYTTVKMRFGNFSFEPGTRYDYIAINRQGVWGPRSTVAYKFEGIAQGTTIFAGAGDYFQFPNSIAWSSVSGNPGIGWQKATKYGGGIDQQFTQEYSIKAEVFKQEFSSLIENDPNISQVFGQNPDNGQLLSQPIVFNRALNFSNRGTGWSHGYEVFLRKQNKPGTMDWFGWIAYTWSQTYRNPNRYNPALALPPQPILSPVENRVLYEFFPNSREVFYDFDQTHIINTVYGWRINESYQLGVRWQYRTSFPITPVVGDDGGQFRNPATGQVFFNRQESVYINSARLAPYHRLDFRIDKFINYEWGYMNLFLEVINFYMRRNQVGINFDEALPFSSLNPVPQNDFSTLQTPGGTVIPLFNVGLEVKF